MTVVTQPKGNERDWEEYFGKYDTCFAGYCRDREVRECAASGGIVSGILIHLLEKQEIDAALVCKTAVKGNKLHYEIKLASNKEEILACASSVYYNIPILAALNQVRSFNGKVAVVGLPCHLAAIQKIIQRDSSLQEKISYQIGLFCGGNCKKELLEEVIKKNKIKIQEVGHLVFQRKHVSGNISLTLSDGRVHKIPFMHYNVYRILGFSSYSPCKHCIDFASEHADISVGDIFTPEYKKKTIKHSAIICRNETASRVLEGMRMNNIINIEEIDPAQLYQSHKKVLHFKKNTSSRILAGKLLGVNIRAVRQGKVRWNIFLASLIYIMNGKTSQKPIGKRIIFAIPKPLLYLYASVFKLLTSF